MAAAGSEATIELPGTANVGDSLYKVDSRDRLGIAGDSIKPDQFLKQAEAPVIRRIAGQVLDDLRESGIAMPLAENDPSLFSGSGGKGGGSLRWWLKVGDLSLLRRSLPAYPERILVTLTPQTLSQFKRERRWLDPVLTRLTWALPPIISEEKLTFYRRAIAELTRGGFVQWQIGHIGQLSLLQEEPARRVNRGKKKKKRPPRRRRLTIIGDYTLNILNSAALRCVSELGLVKAQCSIESDRDNLRALPASAKGIEPGLTIYGAVPLFIARLKSSHFQYDRPFVSPRDERFVLKEAWGQTVAVAEPVFSLLGKQKELAGMGFRYGVVDLSLVRLRKGDLEQIASMAAGKGGKSLRQRTSTFNYLGALQ